MQRLIDAMRWVTVFGLIAGIGFLLAPTNTNIDPFEVGVLADSVPTVTAKAGADSLTEDIILYNLFAPSRTAPSRRYTAGNAAAPDAGADVNAQAMTSSFMPELIGTMIAEKPADSRALLRLLASDPSPRLYAVGDKAGGYTVVSIDARSVVVSGSRGRVVLRLPEHEENHS